MATPPAGTINLAVGQWHSEVMEKFYHESYIGKNYNTAFTFSGKRGITILSTVTQPLVPYALNDDLADVTTGKINVTRFGPLSEAQDEKQDLVMDASYSFNISLERQNRDDQMMLKSAGLYLRDEIREQVTPAIDKYSFHKWANWTAAAGDPGPGITSVTGPAIDRTNAVEEILKVETAFMNAGIPEQNRIVYVPASVYAELRLDNLFVQGPEASFIKQTVTKGTVGMIGSLQVVRIPDSWLINTDATFGGGTWDDSDVQFIATYTPSIIRPIKIQTQRIQTNSDLLDGWLIQGHYYFDAFVIAVKSAGVYVYKKV